MRILHIIAQKPDSTGSGVYLAALVDSLARKGHAQAVIAGIDYDESPEFPADVSFYPVRFCTDEMPFPIVGMSDEMPYPSTRYCDLDSSMVGCFERAFCIRLEKAVQEFKPDVIMCHHLYLLTAIVRERVTDIPVCAFCHSTDLRQLKKHGLERERIIAAVQQLDKVFALHDAQKQETMELFDLPESRIEVVGIGYDSAIFNPIREAPKNDIDTVVFVGKISEKKGVKSLIRSLEHLDLDPARVRFRLIGGQGNKAEYQEICQAAATSRYEIDIPGKMPHRELAREYRNANTFVLPSFYEGLPLVAIEALACGCKVVLTDLPGIRPWLKAQAPDAPVRYVDPPDLRNTDEPTPTSLPAFERALARVLAESIQATNDPVDMSHLSWDNLADQILNIMTPLCAHINEGAE